MSEANDNAAALRALALRIDELVVLSRRLADENRSLRNSQEALVSERANLLAKNEQARSRVEAMISRLRALEQNG
jgi:cell division protein ZapB